MSFYKNIQALKEYKNIEYNEIWEVFDNYFKCDSRALTNKDMLEFMNNMVNCDWWLEKLAEELADSEEEFKVIFLNLKNTLPHFIFMRVLANLDDETAYGQIRDEFNQYRNKLLNHMV